MADMPAHNQQQQEPTVAPSADGCDCTPSPGSSGWLDRGLDPWTHLQAPGACGQATPALRNHCAVSPEARCFNECPVASGTPWILPVNTARKESRSFGGMLHISPC